MKFTHSKDHIMMSTHHPLTVKEHVTLDDLIESNWDPSLVIAWNQHNFNPLISEFVNKTNQILGLDGEDLHGDAFNN